MKRLVWAIWFVYVMGILLTYGYMASGRGVSCRVTDQVDRHICGLSVGGMWPLWWPMRLSYLAFGGQ